MKKNKKKYESYRYSFSRIDEALKARFFLEAVMIEESIMADRLLSVLVKSGLIAEAERKKFSGFASLIRKTENLPVPFTQLKRLDRWREKRNKVAHAIAKSLPGEPTLSTAKFINLAETTATQGRELCRALKEWSRLKQKPAGAGQGAKPPLEPRHSLSV